MSNGYVFLTECADFSEAQVVKSYLVAQGFSPQVRDEQMRTVAPHLSNLLGKLTIDIPEYEFLEASQALEKMERNLHVVRDDEEQAEHGEDGVVIIHEDTTAYTQSLSKKALANAIIGCILVPIICNVFSIRLIYRVVTQEKPLSAKSRYNILWALLFNTIGLYFWLTTGPSLLKNHFHF